MSNKDNFQLAAVDVSSNEFNDALIKLKQAKSVCLLLISNFQDDCDKVSDDYLAGALAAVFDLIDEGCKTIGGHNV